MDADFPFAYVRSLYSDEISRKDVRNAVSYLVGDFAHPHCSLLRTPSPYRRQRTVYALEQLHAFEELFAVNKYPDSSKREQLTARLDLAESRNSGVVRKSSSQASKSTVAKLERTAYVATGRGT